MSNSRVVALQALKQEVQATLLLTAKHLEGKLPKSPPDLNYIPHIPSLNLPLPEDIDHAFDGLPLPPHLITELNHKYRHSIQQIQQLHRQKFEQACQELYRQPQDNAAYPLFRLMEDLRKICESTYTDRYLSMMKNQVISLRSKYAPKSEPKKATFNVECTPLLEKYFSYNAYPSAPDRKVLAEKTAMTVRQIEVWFQNHRKRAKENGRAVRRMIPNPTHNFSLSLDKMSAASRSAGAGNQPESIIVPDEDDDQNGVKLNTTPLRIMENLTQSDNFPARHVYPNRFSLSTAVYRLQSDTSFAFPPPVWSRKPSSQPIPRSDINMDDLIAIFASKLNVRDGTSKSKRKSLFRSQTQNPWFFATTTVPPCAPHPAFIRIPQPTIGPSQPMEVSYTAATSLSVSPQPPTVTSPAPSINQPRPLKKPAPFPKRCPSNYHPYSRGSASRLRTSGMVHFVASTASFASRASPMISMLSRGKRTMEINPTAPPASWVVTLETSSLSKSRATHLEPAAPSAGLESGPTNPDYTLPSASSAEPHNYTSSPATGVTSMESMTPASRVVSYDSDSSFGSRTSSLSSIESPLPASPILQPLSGNSFLDYPDLQFLDEISDFDRLMTGNSQISFNDDLFSPKPEGMFGYALPPTNFMQTLS